MNDTVLCFIFDRSVSDENTIFRLASPVISASLQCDSCTKNNLSDPVEVTFTHQPYDTVSTYYN